ncbi:amino acid transporter [Nocardioides bruguierae]|uniref:amino acid transporter n=1 Tax=Nocardioides bruguierae TaxID=2945102 RepID=UPI002020E8EF|nr:amino acid transporter [Nocardioides bruguierae]MCL8024320.1 amino acid transporter [Nocardioides bruguierae]
MSTGPAEPGASPASSAPTLVDGGSAERQGATLGQRVGDWMLADLEDRVPHQAPHGRPRPEHTRHPWYRVVCLTGVDYFSTIAYQPGIAVLAAGLLSPLATLVLVALTLFGALPVYRRVAQESPHGEGSIAMLERLLSFWKGKAFVLVLLGFAATDFLITITLSAADATAHVVENPHVPASWDEHPVLITLVFIAALGVVFLRGFSEAIGVAVVLVLAFLGINAVVITVGLVDVATHPDLVLEWGNLLTARHGDIWTMLGISALVFPQLALGMSGFETGVAVMPQIRGDEADTEQRPDGRIRGARKLLTTAALIMSGYLLTSNVVVTLLVPHAELEPGGEANGRAIAYLAHHYLGDGPGTVYDMATIAILWFAGASAMAGLLNLIPRYLPRYGMAPDWARAVRPLVLVLLAIAAIVTWLFDADVDAQGGAYATGVLVLMTSGAVAVTLAARHARQSWRTLGFGLVAAVFAYTTASNVVERPDGVKIAGVFIGLIIAVSAYSRVRRAFELRVTEVELDAKAEKFLRDTARRAIRLVANEPGTRDAVEYEDKTRQVVRDNDLRDEGDVVFVEVTVIDPSDFAGSLRVRGEVLHGQWRVLRVEASSVPNALAALTLAARDLTGKVPHIYFEWTEGNPVGQFLRFVFFGAGEVAPVTREVLRRAEPDRARRPHVHVG